jgi:hypothetical protein
MATTFDGRIMTRYIHYTRRVGEWRELTGYQKEGRQTQGPGVIQTSKRLKVLIGVPKVFADKFYRNPTKTGMVNCGRFTLECYLGRPLESWEVCRHGTGGPNDHSYLNVSPGDAVNNMIDDLENGKSYTNLTYMIEAQQRIARIVSSLSA